jgi:DNA (cytosine-5)-methyltransferase 1
MPDKDNFGAVLQPLIEQVKWPADVAPTLNQCRTGSGSPGYSNQELFSQGGGGLVPVMSMDEECNPGIEMIGPIIRGGGGGRHDCVAVPYTKAKRAQSDTDDETWVEGQVNPTLSLFDCGDVRATTIAIQAYSIREDAKANNFSATPTDVRLTVSALVPGVQSHHAQIFLAQAIPLDLRNSQRDPEKHDAQNRQGLGVGSVGDPAPTVDASFVHGVAQVNMQGSKSNACVSTDGSSFTLNAMHGHDVHAVAQAMTVRRLTPRECERLQGFPDDYTLIPWRKKAAADCPDGPRYKALGNSMAVNCMEWIGERIAAVEAAKETT